MSSSSPNTLSRSKRGNECSRVDDEHRLIARYVQRLASCPNNNDLLPESSDHLSFGVGDAKDRRHLVAELEAKNREILREIQQLRVQQRTNCSDFNSHGVAGGACGPALAVELQRLRLRRDELETRMKTLQGSRRELMLQLEALMKLLKNPLTPWSTPVHSPRSKTLPPPSVVGQHASSCFHVPNDSMVTAADGSSRTAVGQDRPQVQYPSTSGTAGSAGMVVNYLRKDLVSATDSVTDAVSSLVKELNSEDSSESEGDIFEFYGGREKFHHSPDRRRTKQSKELNIIPDIRIHKSSTSSCTGFVDLGESEGFVTADDCEPYNDRLAIGGRGHFAFQSSNELYDKNSRELARQRHFPAEEELWLETDQESFIRTDDDDEGGNTDWEDAMKRWINR